MEQNLYMFENQSDVPIIHVGRGCDRFDLPGFLLRGGYLTAKECDEVIARAKKAKAFAKKNNIELLNNNLWQRLFEEPTFIDKPKKITNIYLMIDRNTGLYKIGRSLTPLSRERTLQSEKPTIEMVAHSKGSSLDEKKLHEVFSDKRVRGEWFSLEQSDLDYISNYLKSIAV